MKEGEARTRELKAPGLKSLEPKIPGRRLNH